MECLFRALDNTVRHSGCLRTRNMSREERRKRVLTFSSLRDQLSVIQHVTGSGARPTPTCPEGWLIKAACTHSRCSRIRSRMPFAYRMKLSCRLAKSAKLLIRLG
jgi:hypothetical protein